MSIDVLTAFLAVLLMFFLMLAALEETINRNKEIEEFYYIKSKAVFFADSLVKNSNSEEPEKGIAFYNTEKKSVEENVIDLSLMEKIEEKNFPKYLKEIRLEFEEKKIIIGKKQANCFEARRFVLVKEKKGVLFVSVCK